MYNALVNRPRRLNRNPLLEVAAEVRFASQVPPDTIVGLVYAKVRGEFGAPQNLPIAQIPAPLRDTDPELRFQPLHKFEAPGRTLLLGPRCVCLSTKPYIDWNSTKPNLRQVLEHLSESGLFENVNRVALRYVNFFESINVLEHTTLQMTIAGRSILNDAITLHSVHVEGDFKINTRVGNDATIAGQTPKKGSVIDLDVVCDKPSVNNSQMVDSIFHIFDGANRLADDAFFGLLNPEFVKQFDPEY